MGCPKTLKTPFTSWGVNNYIPNPYAKKTLSPPFTIEQEHHTQGWYKQTTSPSIHHPIIQRVYGGISNYAICGNAKLASLLMSDLWKQIQNPSCTDQFTMFWVHKRTKI